ncbi:hypothetical protein CYMTET_18439 [Cymbomonas tetramitiformis]|uniref:NYN domain-containing protein n=1 Tax=Cymbomonas tetramitiformis TaxID=36881 RepID=A0AAE0G8I2_9CHLO|nr:hypothetical protein CYMTET_18439 [Cymbomonas tetramitiformis]
MAKTLRLCAYLQVQLFAYFALARSGMLCHRSLVGLLQFRSAIGGALHLASIHPASAGFGARALNTASISADAAPVEATRPDVGIFLDSENLLYFLKCAGATRLVKHAAEFGNPIIRKAYGDWSEPGLHKHQQSLVKHGFQLVHTPHPIKGKNAADIAMVVDILETSHRMPSLSCFLLASGDSDFSQVFCHLRQAGRKVIGLGPRSTLSEYVKSTADRYIYIQNEESPPHMETEDFKTACELLKEICRGSIDEAEAGSRRVNASKIKSLLLSQDSAFDHVALGYPRFTDFLAATNLFDFHKGKAA